MSSHEISGSSPGIKLGNPEVCVPLNTAKFRAYRDMQRITATMGLAMSVGFWGFPANLLYIWVMDPTERNPVLDIPGAVISLILPILVGAATWPAMLITKTLSKTLKERLPALVINEQGIQDNASNYVFGSLPWNEIDTVSVESRYAPNINKTFTGVAIALKNKELLLKKKPSILRMWLKMEKEISEKRWVFIPQGRIEMPVEEVVRLANQIKAQHSQ